MIMPAHVGRTSRRALLQCLSALAASAVAAPILHADTAQTSRGIHPPSPEFLQTLPSLMEQAWVPGFAAAVVQGGHMVWQQCFGATSFNGQQLVDARSIFPAASLGKPVFAQAVLQLIDAKQLDLDRPLTTYFDPAHSPLPATSPVTARHVLSHSTGLPNWRDSDAEPLTSSFVPGSFFRYSGEGFYLLQRAVERITGEGFEAWMERTLFAPLHMDSSTYLWRDDVPARLVQGSQGRQPQTYPAFPAEVLEEERKAGTTPWNHDSITRAMVARYHSTRNPTARDMAPNCAWSLLTTVSDYAAFLARLAAPGSAPLDLSPGLRADRARRQTTINSALGWGLGWGTQQNGYLWQWGDNDGWKNFALVHPATQSALVTFSNGSNGMHLADRFVRAATGQDNPAFLWV